MDDLLSRILSFPPHPPPPQPLSDQQYDDGIRAQIEMVSNISDTHLTQETSSGEHILDVINPCIHTVPYVYALIANSSALRGGTDSTISGEMIWQKMTSFLSCFDPRQARYIGSLMTSIIETLADYSRRLRQPEMAIAPIANAILRFDPTGSTLTSHHLLLAQLTLESKTSALPPVFERHILYFPSSTNSRKPKHLCSPNLTPHRFLTNENGLTRKLKYQDVLEYFILCGTIYITLQEWDKALDVLASAITYPIKDNAVSKIMVEAYKKWMLVHLIRHGKAGKLPSTTNSNAAKVFRTLATPYETVANLFESASALRLHQEVQFGSQIWNEDTNSGLMQLVLAAYQKFQIRHLAKTYRSISISEITRLTMSAETGTNLPSDQATEDVVANMISQGTLNATILRSANMPAVLEFKATDQIHSELEVQQQLAASIERLRSMVDNVKSTDCRLTYEKEYLKWVARQKMAGKNAGADGSMVDDSWNGGSLNPVEDEDLMATENF